MSMSLQKSGGEEGEKITRDPKILTGLQLKEEKSSLRRHPSLEGKAVIKVNHEPILPTGL